MSQEGNTRGSHNLVNLRHVKSRMSGACSLMALALAMCGVAGAAQAQQAAGSSACDPSKPGCQAVEQVVVTGSRITLKGFTAPTPVSVVTGDTLKTFGSVDASALVTQAPVFRADQSNTTYYGTPGVTNLDMRGLGAVRTLVLVDGKRFVSSGGDGTVNVALIPTELLQRVEVVTGGASAAYGSDAVAGVTNFILNRNLTGLKGQIEYGQSQYGDNRTYQASIAGGTDFMGGRGHIIGSFEYSNVGGVGTCYARPFCNQKWNLIGNTAWSPSGGNTLPKELLINPLLIGVASPSGLINGPAPLKGIAFNPDGSQYQFQYGKDLGFFWMWGGTERYPEPFYTHNLAYPVTRANFYSHANYDFGGGIEGDLDFSLARTSSRALALPPSQSTTHLTIHRDNPYIPANIAAIMDANGLTSFVFGRTGYDAGTPLTKDTMTTGRVVAELKGAFNDSWTWDGYYEYGTNLTSSTHSLNYQSPHLNNALDAVRTPGGQIICRVALTDPGTACAPIDWFGQNGYSPAAMSYIFGTSWYRTRTTEHVAEVNVQGTLFHVQGGDVAIIVGGDYRYEGLNTTTDPLSAQGLWHFNTSPVSGAYHLFEGFGEVDVPLLKDQPWAKTLDLNGAVRVTDYSNSGTVNTWKLGAVWEPTDYVRLRFTRSRDIRAPNAQELFSPQSQGLSRVFDNNNGKDYLVDTTSGGNPDLTPEIGDTWTAGMVLTPKWGFTRHFNFSADWFRITLNNAIESIGGQAILDQCGAKSTSLCHLITFDIPGNINSNPVHFENLIQNIAQIYTDGVDFELDYNQSTGFGDFQLRALATWVDHLTITDTSGAIDRAGQTGMSTGAIPGEPHWESTTTLTYNNGPWQVSLQGHYIGAGKYNNQWVGPDQPNYSPDLSNSVSHNLVGNRLYFNFGSHYDFEPTQNGQIELFFTINNLLNTTPPVAPQDATSENPTFFDPIGRMYYMGVRFLD